MRAEKTMVKRTAHTYRLTETAEGLLGKLQKHLTEKEGPVSETKVIELAIRALARKEGVKIPAAVGGNENE